MVGAGLFRLYLVLAASSCPSPVFSDWLNFEVGIMVGGEQVGNAMPFEVAKALQQPLQKAVFDLRKAEERADAA